MKKIITLLLLGILLGISGTALVNYIANRSWNPSEYLIQTDTSGIINNIKAKINPTKYDKFETILQIIKQQYYQSSGQNEPIDETKMIEHALHGFVDGLGDPYTSYFDIEEKIGLDEVLIGNQNFEGIGAVVSRKSDGILINEVLKGSPAQLVGLKPLDLIIAISGTSVEGMSVSDAVKLIRGPKGSVVTVDIFRASTQSVQTYDITRDSINVPSVSWNILTKTGSDLKIGYISLSVFGEDTYNKFRDALTALNNETLAGYIIDLRGNGGGFLPTAVDIASHFVPKGNVIVTTRYSMFPEETFKSDGRPGANPLIPIVVLVDGYSASASEVLALALKQNNDATLIGTETFGKGSIQTLYDFSDGSSLKYTIGSWYAPDNRNVTGSGIIPDIDVPFNTTGYVELGVDNQLDKAISYIIP